MIVLTLADSARLFISYTKYKGKHYSNTDLNIYCDIKSLNIAIKINLNLPTGFAFSHASQSVAMVRK